MGPIIAKSSRRSVSSYGNRDETEEDQIDKIDQMPPKCPAKCDFLACVHNDLQTQQ